MSSELADFTAGRIREVFLNGTFIANTNYRQAISGIGWQDAIKHPQGLNSIAALVFHINYYLHGLLAAFKSGKLEIHDKFSFDMPDIRSEADWKALTESFLRNAASFSTLVESFPADAFNKDFINPKYGTVARNIEAVIEHSYYHLGQIVLLKKLVCE